MNPSTFPTCSRRLPPGFTLIETLLALALIALVLPLALQGISLASALGSKARQEAEATALARSKLAELAATNQWKSSPLAGAFDEPHAGYAWSADTFSWNNGVMTQLDVHIHWTWRNQPCTLTLSTLVNPGE